jgi:hypothetical protein
MGAVQAQWSAEAFEESSLTKALCRNMHETVAGISALLPYKHLSRVALIAVFVFVNCALQATG